MSTLRAGIPQPDQFHVYMNLDKGIRIDYPEGWITNEKDDPTGFMVMFNSPPEDLKDQFSENLNIIVQPLPAPMPVEEYVRASVDQMAQTPLQLLETTPCTVCSEPGYKLSFIGPAPMGPFTCKWLQWMTVRDRRAFVVTYTAEAAKYDLFEPVIQRMISSLQIK